MTEYHFMLCSINIGEEEWKVIDTLETDSIEEVRNRAIDHVANHDEPIRVYNSETGELVQEWTVTQVAPYLDFMSPKVIEQIMIDRGVEPSMMAAACARFLADHLQSKEG